MGKYQNITVVMADDDEEDCLLVRDAFKAARIQATLDTVGDGEELLDYLRGQSAHVHRAGQPLPDLILLDLNMPRKNGWEVLREIKAEAQWRTIPVVVLTTSRVQEDIRATYDSGVSSFITKPLTFGQLVAVIGVLTDYWFGTVKLPRTTNH
jgi:CheY-like chemotaxis protein